MPLTESFAIERPDGSITYVEAHNFKVDGAGRLIFYKFIFQKVAAYQAGEWLRAMRGLSPDDLKQGGA